jgi:hypothetical protein
MSDDSNSFVPVENPTDCLEAELVETVETVESGIHFSDTCLPVAASEADFLDEPQAGDPSGHRMIGRQRVILPEGCSKGVAIHILSKSIPVNEYNLPIYYLRSDILPYDLGDLTQDDVDGCVASLSYAEGYPSTPENRLWWSQLPHEPFASYILFQEYLKQAVELGIRQIELLADAQKVQLEDVTEMYHEYFWSARARAYDLFQSAADRKKRELRIRSAEDHDYKLATKMMEKLQARFSEEPDAEWWNELTAKEALDALEQLLKIRRLSLGLTGQHASSLPRNGIQSESVEVIMKSLVGAGMTAGADAATDIRSLLADPESAMMAQTLIIRATRQNTPVTDNQEATFE